MLSVAPCPRRMNGVAGASQGGPGRQGHSPSAVFLFFPEYRIVVGQARGLFLQDAGGTPRVKGEGVCWHGRGEVLGRGHLLAPGSTRADSGERTLCQRRSDPFVCRRCTQSMRHEQSKIRRPWECVQGGARGIPA